MFHVCRFLTFAEKGLDRKLVWLKLPHGEKPFPLGCLGSSVSSYGSTLPFTDSRKGNNKSRGATEELVTLIPESPIPGQRVLVA